MNVNFWNKTYTLYINGIECGSRRITLFERGDKCDLIKRYNNDLIDGVSKRYDRSLIDETTREDLSAIFGICFAQTPFTHRVYCFQGSSWFDYTNNNWNKLSGKTGRIFADDIKTLEVFIEYEIRESVSMKRLFDYPADLVIEYLKERGITSCPMIKE